MAGALCACCHYCPSDTGRIHTAGTLGRRRCTRYAGRGARCTGRCRPFFSKGGCHAGGTAPQVQETVEQDIITQETEETVAIKPKAEPKKKEEVKKPEKTEAEKAEEARKLAAAKAERERKEAEEAARKRVAGAFGKGAQMGSKGDTEGEGIQGSPTGNAPSGATSGTGGYGSFNLGGRSLGEGGLPRPVYNVQDEGRVVVTITVNPAGHVIATSINRQTNTVNPALRKAAEDAAKKARFMR